MSAGYTHCACRDCMDQTVSRDDTRPELCSDCLDAGCDDDGASECTRDDAYGADDLAAPVPATVEAAILAITGGRDGSQVRVSLHADSDGEIVWYANLWEWSRVSAGYVQRLQGRGATLRLAVSDLHSRQAIGADPVPRSNADPGGA